MQKTFCDTCKAECVNITVKMGGEVRHTTNKGEYLAEAYIEPLELCNSCFQKLAAEWPFKVRSDAEIIQRKMEREHDRYPDELSDAAARPALG